MVKIPEFPELTFDEAGHLYHLNGVEIPSVTTVMKPLSSEVYRITKIIPAIVQNIF